MLRDLKNLIPTHNRLRNIQTVLDLIINRKDLYATISLINGNYYVHDGHHSIVAYLFDQDLKLSLTIKKYSLDDYVNPNLPVWLTPFNPESEVRLPDFFGFKKEAENKPESWILEHKHLYAEKRKISSMESLYAMFLLLAVE